MHTAALASSLQRPQTVALGVSVAVHAVLLAMLGGNLSRLDSDPVFVVTLMPEAVSALAPAQVVIEKPRPLAEPVRDPLAVEAATPTPTQAAAPQPPAPVSDKESKDATPRIKSRPGIPPELAHELSNRRLRVSMWIEETGAVSKVDLEGNELSPEAVASLSESLMHVRFARAAHETVLRTRMCFDSAGAIETEGPECSTFALRQ